MPAAAGAAVAAWWAGAGVAVTAGSAAAIAGAITTAAVTGVLVGGAIGAATSLITGGDILQGTLKGALIGGVSGGLLKGASIGMAAMESSAALATAAPAISTGASAASGALTTATAETSGLDAVAKTTGAPTVPPPVPTTGDKVVEALVAGQKATAENSWKAPVYAGMAQGAGTGLMNLVASNKAGDAQKELLEAQQAGVNLNQAGLSPAQQRIAAFSFKPKTEWENIVTKVSAPLTAKYSPQPKGLLAGGVA